MTEPANEELRFTSDRGTERFTIARASCRVTGSGSRRRLLCRIEAGAAIVRIAGTEGLDPAPHWEVAFPVPSGTSIVRGTKLELEEGFDAASETLESQLYYFEFEETRENVLTVLDVTETSLSLRVEGLSEGDVRVHAEGTFGIDSSLQKSFE